jgi:aspartate aminotransferase
MLAHRTRLVAASATAVARNAAAGLADVIDLTAGEIWTDPPQAVIDGAVHAITRGVNRYTDTIGLSELREAVAEKVSGETGQSFSRDEIAITAGAKQALFNAALCLFDPGDQVIIPAPYWGTFAAQARLVGATPVFVDTSASGFVPRLDDIARAVTPLTRALIINTPNNPTGAVYDAATLNGLAQLAIERDFWLIFDECYGTFTHVGLCHHPIVSLVPDIRERLVTVNAFSKSLALTGWRIGYMAAPANLIVSVRALQSHTTSNVNVIAQHAVLNYLTQGDRSYEASLLTKLTDARERGLETLSQLKDIPLPIADGGFYFYLDLRRLSDRGPARLEQYTADIVARSLLTEAGVATVSGSGFGDPHGLRLSYGIDPSLLQEGCRRLVRHLNGWGTPKCGDCVFSGGRS